MAPPARDKKRGVSKTLDPKRRVQKSAINAGRAQPRATTVARSVEKANVMVEKITSVQESLSVVAPSTQPSAPTMDIDTKWDSEQEPESDVSSPSNQKPCRKGLLLHGPSCFPEPQKLHTYCRALVRVEWKS
ncbi:hypothetical protein EPUL_004057 [Erysiphe pulchra]|uniref:Uncharacterized protein n=1 Tax=Erysiphe pulchra TaxID=225359 RepID=A0A2S4PKP1_9PEZI|nr:hypothetical protein EPUL_004057 [Erysiphe pulchra]